MEQHSRQRYEDYKSFMRRHQATVWRVCYDFARGDIPRCEDMVQEAWIILWLKFDTMTGRSEWQQRVWVRRVTRSVLVDLYRREHPPLEPINATMEETVATESSDVAERIDDLFVALTPDEQRLMRMRLDGYSAKEIAAEQKIENNAVYQRVNRIMNKLRQYATRL
ncbi:MAG: sigma-70 family RNA polymerase sigma factor [Bacteroidales bacterium]|nr:sigma-70 family RNA polymerase sigma factor [Bacteroidales bacterium]